MESGKAYGFQNFSHVSQPGSAFIPPNLHTIQGSDTIHHSLISASTVHSSLSCLSLAGKLQQLRPVFSAEDPLDPSLRLQNILLSCAVLPLLLLLTAPATASVAKPLSLALVFAGTSICWSSGIRTLPTLSGFFLSYRMRLSRTSSVPINVIGGSKASNQYVPARVHNRRKDLYALVAVAWHHDMKLDNEIKEWHMNTPTAGRLVMPFEVMAITLHLRPPNISDIFSMQSRNHHCFMVAHRMKRIIRCCVLPPFVTTSNSWMLKYPPHQNKTPPKDIRADPPNPSHQPPTLPLAQPPPFYYDVHVTGSVATHLGSSPLNDYSPLL
ncbi:hypothetical protein HPP92_022094 [Vanilla planifolia]|uniref:Uncharacterized protein n=1 Tax=Vanilla planifolia TaxID=51239 RepID=A0A835UGX2_VANPL|nr:hypothetical protein HPP92_022094 [Vanilla planifolia]